MALVERFDVVLVGSFKLGGNKHIYIFKVRYDVNRSHLTIRVVRSFLILFLYAYCDCHSYSKAIGDVD